MRRGYLVTRGSRQNGRVSDLDPGLAAALDALGLLDPRRRPMLAAHWLADGLDTRSLRELAGLHGDEPDVLGLWQDALTELGILPSLEPRLAAARWVAQRLVDEERSVRRLTSVLWPSGEIEATSPQGDQLDRIVVGLDQLIAVSSSLAEGAPRAGLWRGRRDRQNLARAESTLALVPQVISAVAAADLDRAETLLKRART